MIEIKLTIDGKKQPFKKRDFTIRDNMLAIKHQIMATAYYTDETKANNPEEYEKVQVNFVKTIAQMFDNQFDYEQLFTLPVADMAVLDLVYKKALGGDVEDEEGKK